MVFVVPHDGLFCCVVSYHSLFLGAYSYADDGIFLLLRAGHLYKITSRR